MYTLKGVIAATTRRRRKAVPAESDLFIEPWYFVLSSEQYVEEPGNGNEPDPDPDPGSGEWEGGLGVGEGGQGWYRFAVANVELDHTYAPHSLSISSTLSVEGAIQSLKDNISLYIGALGYEGAKQAVRNNLVNLFENLHINIVRANSVLSYPQSIFSGQPDEGALSVWHLMELPGDFWYAYGANQEQIYIDPNNWEIVDGDIIYVDIGPPADMVFDAPDKQMAWSFLGCEGPEGPEPGPIGPGGYYCPEEYGVNWHIEKIVEVNYDAIVDWIMPPKVG